MPTYDYKCLDCGKRFEYRRGLDMPHPSCPVCDSQRVEVLPPVISLRFIGAGFYENDYKRRGVDDE